LVAPSRRFIVSVVYAFLNPGTLKTYPKYFAYSISLDEKKAA
jgi:hypothetical protein